MFLMSTSTVGSFDNYSTDVNVHTVQCTAPDFAKACDDKNGPQF